MSIFSTVVFVLAAVLVLPALLMLRGSTGWLHSFKKGKYTDAKAYSRLLGKTLLGIALSLAGSGLAALINAIPVIVPVIILIAGIIVTMAFACKIAKEYYK